MGDDPPGTQKGASFPLDKCIALIPTVETFQLSVSRNSGANVTAYKRLLLLSTMPINSFPIADDTPGISVRCNLLRQEYNGAHG
jgi:hypothetical protein